MNKKTLEKELKKLKYYLKVIDNSETVIDASQTKIISHTLVGMIMTIHNLINTGAYDQVSNDSELFSLIEQARHSAIHYGYFNDYNNIYPEAKKISEHLDEANTTHFASNLKHLTYQNDSLYYCLSSCASGSIKETLDDFIEFKNLHTKEIVYVKKSDLIIVTNKLKKEPLYLLKSSDEETLFYKKNDEGETEKISANSLLKRGFFDHFNLTSTTTRIDLPINKLLEQISDDPYNQVLVNYRYNDRSYAANIQTILKTFLYENSIDEKILYGKFTLSFPSDIEKIEEISLHKMPIKAMISSANFTDMFFLELYLKRFNAYKNLKEEANARNLEFSNYAKQSYLINLFEVGAAYLSERFINSDNSGEFASLYYDYKRTRNELAHLVITSDATREIAVNNLEAYSQAFYSVASSVFETYCKEKIKDPLLKFPIVKKLDDNHSLVSNKTSTYLRLKHLSMCKIIDGKKYLRLDTHDNVYLEVDGSIFSLNYNTLTSKECFIPLNYARFVEIDPNTNRIKNFHYNYHPDELVQIDTFSEALFQAQDYIKSYPQYQNHNFNYRYFSVITFLNSKGEATYSEGLRHLLYRRVSQKILPDKLIEATSLVIPKDIDEPLLILNKAKQPIAKVYIGCLQNINGKEILTQLLKNREQKTIDYGKLLPKDLKTNELTFVTKGRKY